MAEHDLDDPHVTPTEIGPGDRDLLEELVGVLWDGTSAEDIVLDILLGNLAAWRVDGGLVLTMVCVHPRGRELFVYGIVGSGILAQGREIVRRLREIAAESGCSMIGAQGVPRGWLRAATRLGFAPVSTRYLMET